MRKLLVFLVLVLEAVTPAAAQQVNPKDVLSGFALRDTFRDRRAITRNLFAERLLETKPVSFRLLTGVAYSDAGGGVSTTALPQQLDITFNNTDPTTISFIIDAYGWRRQPGANASGVGDPALQVARRLWCSDQLCETNFDAISVAGGITIPSGSEVSGGTAGQNLILVWGRRYVLDSFEASVRLDHINKVETGISNYVTTSSIYYQHNFTDDLDVFASVDYSYQSGAGGVTVAGAGIDFPISGRSFGPFEGISGTLSGACALSGSHRCGRIQLDLVLPFK